MASLGITGYGFIIWFGVSQEAEIQRTTERKSGLCEPSLRGSDETCLPREVRRSQWRRRQYVLVSVFIRVRTNGPCVI